MLTIILTLALLNCPEFDTNNDGYVYYDDIVGNLELSMHNLLYNVETVNLISECITEPFIWSVPLWVYEGDTFEVEINMPVGNLSRNILISSESLIYLIDSSDNLMLFGTDRDFIAQGYRKEPLIIVVVDTVWNKTWLLPLELELRD